ncbi:GntR family transcriptional regulator [Humitalea sp. 24SJ18S-53]|uniref:GntR family transcriptional regulator n=1 Tax=Humitalea sp. 24SJ18S-53 TaxID=3422307 RepID=UPI003D66EA18
MPDSIPSAPRRALNDVVRASLEQRMLDGSLAPGTRLNEAALAAELGVSRGPVREALRTLQQTGLVEGEAHRGMRVRVLEAAEVAEIYDMRALLNGFACARLAGRGEPTALRAMVAAMQAAIEAGDREGYYRLNLDFHQAIFVAAGHKRVAAAYDAALREGWRSRWESLESEANMRASNAEHTATLDAIASGDAAEARRLGEEHVLAGKRRWLAKL